MPKCLSFLRLITGYHTWRHVYALSWISVSSASFLAVVNRAAQKASVLWGKPPKTPLFASFALSWLKSHYLWESHGWAVCDGCPVTSVVIGQTVSCANVSSSLAYFPGSQRLLLKTVTLRSVYV